MKTLKIIAVLVALLAAAAAGAAPEPVMGVSDGHDLDALYARARKTYDLAKQDAVVLLDSRTVSVGDEGTVVTRVHTVVWIGSNQGIRHYADLRVPWNAATSTLDVEMLRTWRDGQWWPDPQKISDTAVVETLPYAAARADDYTNLRETMLLHDGVELPCILETAYTIAVQGPPTAGADDVHVFPGRDPVLEADYAVRAPLGTEVKYQSLNGAPEPVASEDDLRTLTWTVSNAGKLKLPVLEQPAAYEPAVVWSTWESWDTLLAQFDEAVDAAAVAGPALTDSVAALVRGVPDGIDRVKKVIDYAEQSVRLVHTDVEPWLLAPRPAQRTYETGYGHALDRAVFTAALLKALPRDNLEAKSGPRIALASESSPMVASDLPRFSGLTGVLIKLASGPDFYDTARGILRDRDGVGSFVLFTSPDGRAVRAPGTRGRFQLDVSLEPDGTEWSGSASLTVSGTCLDGPRWSSGDEPVADAVAAMLKGVFGDFEVTSVTSATMTGVPDGLQVRFGLRIPDPAGERTGPPRLLVGEAATCFTHHLPESIHIPEATRESPLPALSGDQQVTVRLRTGEGGVAWVPAARTVENSAGSFAVSANQEGGWLTFVRSLAVRTVNAPDASWPDLRALLLEEQDPANGTIVLETTKK